LLKVLSCILCSIASATCSAVMLSMMLSNCGRCPEPACAWRLAFVMMQVYELDAFRVTHVSHYPAPVLSVGISPNSALLAVGLADGQLVVRKHSHNKGPAGATRVTVSNFLGCVF
jgi:hypothetical protein